MAITQTQLNQAREAVRDMQKILSDLNEIISIADRAVLQDKEGNAIVSLTSNQKTKLLVEYEKTKIELTNAFAYLP